MHNRAYPSNQVLAAVIKHNPRNGQVIIQWEDETYVGSMDSVEITRRVDEPAGRFTISGFILDDQE